MNDNKNKQHLEDLRKMMNNIQVDYWDVDCDCNMLNDLDEDGGFYEDRSTIDN